MPKSLEIPVIGPAARSLRSKHAYLTRAGRTEDAAVVAREFSVERLAEHIRTVVAQAPPLTDDQKSHLRSCINGGDAS